MDFLWHEVSEKEKEDIKNQAREIMNSFEKELKKVESKKVELGVKRKDQLRDEEIKVEAEYDLDFRKIFFYNAPKKDGELIKAERGSWKR